MWVIFESISLNVKTVASPSAFVYFVNDILSYENWLCHFQKEKGTRRNIQVVSSKESLRSFIPSGRK